MAQPQSHAQRQQARAARAKARKKKQLENPGEGPDAALGHIRNFTLSKNRRGVSSPPKRGRGRDKGGGSGCGLDAFFQWASGGMVSRNGRITPKLSIGEEGRHNYFEFADDLFQSPFPFQ